MQLCDQWVPDVLLCFFFTECRHVVIKCSLISSYASFLQSFDKFEVTGIVCPTQRILTAGWSQVIRVYIDSRQAPDESVIQWSRQHSDDISALVFCPPSTIVTGTLQCCDTDALSFDHSNDLRSLIKSGVPTCSSLLCPKYPTAALHKTYALTALVPSN